MAPIDYLVWFQLALPFILVVIIAWASASSMRKDRNFKKHMDRSNLHLFKAVKFYAQNDYPNYELYLAAAKEEMERAQKFI